MHEKVNTAISSFCALLKEIYAEDFLALVLYGSAAGTAYRADVSDINVLVILEKNSAANVFKLGKAAKAIFFKYRISPFIMTRKELASSLDVFPLEFCDILDMNTVVYGDKDILNLTVSREHLRHEMEEKLRGSVNDIYNMILTAAGDEKILSRFLANWSGMGGILFRGLLRLKGKSVSAYDTKTILAETKKEYGVTLDSFLVLNELRHNKTPLPILASIFADTLLEALNALITKVDAMDGAA